ncbi:MAG: hypothetical protein ABI889_06165 [Gemmatimonadota bacterium]
MSSFLGSRAQFILFKGILRCGVPLALAVFAWTVLAHATGRTDLSSGPWWRATIAVFVIAMLEWGVGAGWLIGAVWWGFTNAQETRRR